MYNSRRSGQSGRLNPGGESATFRRSIHHHSSCGDRHLDGAAASAAARRHGMW